MNNMQYKVVDIYGNVVTIFKNDAYDMVHDSRMNGLKVDYKTNNLNLVINNLIVSLVKTNNELNNIIAIVNNLVVNNIISLEIGNYILKNINTCDIEENDKQYKKS